MTRQRRRARARALIGVVLRAGVIASSVCLRPACCCRSTGGGSAAPILLNVGIVVLLATPSARVVVSTVEYLIERDWTFATLTAIVLLELIASAVAALVFNRKI